MFVINSWTTQTNKPPSPFDSLTYWLQQLVTNWVKVQQKYDAVEYFLKCKLYENCFKYQIFKDTLSFKSCSFRCSLDYRTNSNNCTVCSVDEGTSGDTGVECHFDTHERMMIVFVDVPRNEGRACTVWKPTGTHVRLRKSEFARYWLPATGTKKVPSHWSTTTQ